MFNWICPECGRDVPPSESECRYCAERKKAAEVPVPAAVPSAQSVPPPAQNAPQPVQPAPQTQWQSTPPPQSVPPSAQPQPQYYAQPPAKSGLPTWALSILFALAFIGLGAAIFF